MAKKKVGVIASAAVACTVCASMIAGATFALFTDNDKVDISVTTATVDVEATIGEIATSSNGTSANANLSATLDEAHKSLTVTNMLPGDVVAFPVTVTSNSTVDVKYRVSFGCDEESNALFDELLLGVKDTQAAEYDYYVNGVSAWKDITYHEDGTEMTVSQYVLVELPAYVSSSSLYNKKCNISFAVEAVQANANGLVNADTSHRAFRLNGNNGTTIDDTIISKLPDTGSYIVIDDTTAHDWTITTNLEKEFSVKGATMGTLTINAPNATVHDYVVRTESITVGAVAGDSLHVYGVVADALTLNEGHVVVEESAEVAKAVVSPAATQTATFETKSDVVSLEVTGAGVADVTIADKVVVSDLKVENESATIENKGEVAVTTKEGLLAAVKVGGEINLANDIDMGEDALLIGTSVTLNGNGYKVESIATRTIRITQSGINVTLLNLGAINKNAGTYIRGISIDPDTTGITLTLDRCEVTASYYAINICDGAAVDLTVKNSKITGWGAINAWAAKYTIDVTDSTLIGINDKPYNAAGWNGFGTVVIEGDTTNKTEDHASEVDIALTRCKIVAESKTGNIQKAILFNAKSKSNNVILTDCEIELENENCLVVLDNGTDNHFEMIDTKTGEKFVGAANVEQFKAILSGSEDDIILTNNITLTETLVIDRSVNIEMAGWAFINEGLIDPTEKEVAINVTALDVTFSNGILFSNKNFTPADPKKVPSKIVLELTGESSVVLNNMGIAGRIGVASFSTYEGKVLTVNGGVIDAAQLGIYVAKQSESTVLPEVSISNLAVGSDRYAVELHAAKAVIEDTEIDYSRTQGAAGVAVYANTVLTMNRCNVYASSGKGYYAVAGNGDNRPENANYGSNTTITLTDCTLSGEYTGMYLPQYGSVTTVNGGSITGNIESGIELRAGTLVLNNVNVTCTSKTFTALVKNTSGTTSQGGIALVVSQHSTDDTISVTVNGGSLNGIYAMLEKDVQKPESGRDKISVTIDDKCTVDGYVYSENSAETLNGFELTDPANVNADGTLKVSE